jgi:hypothetical protein
MKRKLPILAVIAAVIVSLIMLIPSQVFAANGSLPSEEPDEDLIITVNKGNSDTPTKIKVCATDAPEGEWYYEFFVLKYPGTIEDLNSEPNPEDFIVYDADGIFYIEEEGGSDCHSYSVQLGEGHYFAMVFVFNDELDGISHSSAGVAQNFVELVAWNYNGFTIKDTEPEEEVWMRDNDFQCWQVWINEQNQFEFVFVWEYANNNHVQILDQAGNIVFYIDLPKGDCHFVADLPDGTYTVQNYHEYGHILREFVISKP